MPIRRGSVWPYASPYQPLPLGGIGAVPPPTDRFASWTSASRSPTPAAPIRPTLPPPKAAPAAIRRATLALDTVRVTSL